MSVRTIMSVALPLGNIFTTLTVCTCSQQNTCSPYTDGERSLGLRESKTLGADKGWEMAEQSNLYLLNISATRIEQECM